MKIQNIVSAEAFERFENYCMIEYLKADPTARWCPWEDCDNVMTGITAKTKELVQCSKCVRDFCGNCSQKWHVTSTCDEALRAARTVDDPK
jgi:hypothetical protein